jgi:hypothetical protein
VYGTDGTLADTDGDGLGDGDEVDEYSTDPLDPDTDNDGYSDGLEVADGSDPTDDTSAPGDVDGDGLLDQWEFDHFGSRNAQSGGGDPDGDSLNNLDEQAFGSDPNRADRDGDGLGDREERTWGTDPYDADSDGDGLEDGAEDFDKDGVLDAEETDPTRADTDGDGANDDIDTAPRDPLAGGPDADGDGIFDGADNDNDYDGVPDADEPTPAPIDVGVAALGQEPGSNLWSPSSKDVRLVIRADGEISTIRAYVQALDGTYYTDGASISHTGRVNPSGYGIVELGSQAAIEAALGGQPFQVKVVAYVAGHGWTTQWYDEEAYIVALPA